LPPARPWPGATQAAAIVIITDPLAGGGNEAAALLGTIYGLTPAEARVALLVGDGRNLPEVAAVLKVSQNTAHTHLQRVFRKTGARRQADLARIASSLPKLASV
jgi:DNA-binding CsgD family transcriptional regulator